MENHRFRVPEEDEVHRHETKVQYISKRPLEKVNNNDVATDEKARNEELKNEELKRLRALQQKKWEEEMERELKKNMNKDGE